jgi:predicted dehydrogenase
VRRNTRSRVVAVGSRSAERARQFADRFGIERAYGSYEALVSDPGVDAVYIASPHSEHYHQATLALAAGKPLLIEKAFTQNAAQAAEVLATAGAAGILVMEAMWTRFLPHLDVIRQLIADGGLGEVRTVIADHGQYFDVGPEHRLLNPSLAGGSLLDLGIYPVSFASFVLGRPDSVTAQGELTATGVDAQVSAVLRTGPAHALVSSTLTAKTPTTATVSGTLARIELAGDFYQPQQVRLIHRDGREAWSEVTALSGHHGIAYEAAHFAGLLAEGAVESPLLPWSETLDIMRTLDEIRAQIGLHYPGESV